MRFNGLVALILFLVIVAVASAAWLAAFGVMVGTINAWILEGPWIDGWHAVWGHIWQSLAIMFIFSVLPSGIAKS